MPLPSKAAFQSQFLAKAIGRRWFRRYMLRSLTFGLHGAIVAGVFLICTGKPQKHFLFSLIQGSGA